MISTTYNTDCVEYMQSLPDKYFDLAIADPPYGRGADDGNVERTGGSWFTKYGKSIKEWDVAPTEKFFSELERVSKNRIIWGANYFDNMPATRCFVIWKKLTISESFSMAMAEYAWTSFDGNAKVFECAPQGKQKDIRFHPTTKPVELYAWLMRLFAKDGDKIFDPMMGSQSSRIAAHNLGLDYVGCEISEDYYRLGCERFDRLCNGIYKADNGKTYQQLNLF